ncbi:eukaryotic translation initiation factor 4 gamma 2 [Lingula anatina]|uniref:Eukaryotic translation initiation factor 4 gamma 2 n=1 Tax=Lingula anatina TaxID=7574 RepID=A0A1S3IAI0_LINAN|nr:eukaryotic translation initiation factor 4 gamma 2 [Lingula anatina]|eukprot:XP_013394414.1 eukaryotic translation initiation factor 4 gamma 2 [Lingula anatina]
MLVHFSISVKRLREDLVINIILDGQGGSGGASRRAGGRDERSPLLSGPVATSANQRWIPPSSVKRDALTQDEKHDSTFRKVRGILNKLTPEKFDKLGLELLNVGIDSPVVLKGIILLIFEKSLDEPKYSSLYAQLCQRLCEDAPNFEPASSNNTSFRRHLLNKCQDEFENRSKATNEFDKRDTPLTPEELEKYHAAKFKMLGNIKFIGELGKLDMLHEGILHKCIKQLLEKKKHVPIQETAEDLECLCQIMKTVGRRLDTDKAKALMDQYFSRMKTLMMNNELPTRIRFLLQDTIELRENNWTPRKVTRGSAPRTITQIREEAAKDMGVYLPPPGVQGIRNLDLFGPPTMNGSGFGRGQMDMFGPLPAGPGGFSSIGTGPGVISMDGVAPGYSPNTGRRKNQQGQGYNQYRRQEGGSPKQHRHQGKGPNPQQQQQQQQSMQQQPSTQQNLQKQRDFSNLPPRLAKKAQQAAQGGVGGGGSNPTGQTPQLSQGTAAQIPTSASSHPPPPVINPPQNQMAHMSVGNGIDEHSFRPATLGFGMFKPQTPNSLPKSTQIPQTMSSHKMPGSASEPLAPPLLQKQQAQITIKTVPSTEKIKEKKKPVPTKEEIQKTYEDALEACLSSGSFEDAVNTIKNLRPPNRFIPEMLKHFMTATLEKSDENRETAGNLIAALKNAGVVTGEQYMEAFNSLLESMPALEDDIPLIRSYVSKFAACAVAEGVISLADLAAPMENGSHYPLFMLCLQQIHKLQDEDWLVNVFNESKIDLQNMLPEGDRSKERMLKILEDRDLSFMFPLLRVQAELSRQIQGDPSPTDLYKWMKENIDPKLFNKTEFIHGLVTTLLRYITSQSTLADGADPAAMPEKHLVDKEKEILDKYKSILQLFLHDKLGLQLSAVYALQVHCYNKGFPKGMLLRMFMHFYDMEIIDEEVFLKWKEEVNDEHPGKGKSLFQVNQWLTWLEQAEDESEEEDEEEE